MRYTLFGEAQGVMASCTALLWGAVQNGVIKDASVAAREQGIRVGMNEKSAKALLPSMELCPVSAEPQSIMKQVWRIIGEFTPWVEPVEHNRFYAQLPTYLGTSEEVRQILAAVDEKLSSTQRVRAGFAENKQLARALVEWSRYGSIPDAGFFTVSGQQLIVSPSILYKVDSENELDWIRGLPVAAMWMISNRNRQELINLGITTFGQLQDAPEEHVRLRFGKEIWFWKHHFNTDTKVLNQNQNLPLLHRKADIERANPEGNGRVDISGFLPLAEELSDRLAVDLSGRGLGVRKIQLCWETDEGKACVTRSFERLLYTKEAIWAHLLPALTDIQGTEIQGTEIEDMELYGEEYEALQGTQAGFRVYERQILPVQYNEAEKISELMSRVNKKFPHKLQRGLTGGFRELRLEAMGEL